MGAMRRSVAMPVAVGHVLGLSGIGNGADPRATVRGLAPGESRTLTFGGTFAGAGSARTSAVVDVFHQVAGPGRQGNNTATRTVTVEGPG